MTADARETASLNPNALPVEAATKLLDRVQPGVTEAMLRADLAAGAPANPDGTLNLLHDAAWLVKEAA